MRGDTPYNRDGTYNRPFGGFGLLTFNPGSGTANFDGSPEPYNSRSLVGATPTSSSEVVTPTQGTNHTVTIRLGNQSTVIHTASASDADALAALLRQLETAAGRGG
jgi:hypothetical protein